MKLRWLRFLLVTPFLCFLMVLFVSQLGRDPSYIRPIVMSASFCGALAILFSEYYGALLLGLGLCLMPLLGSGALNAFFCVWLFGFELRRLAFSSTSRIFTHGSEILVLFGFLSLLLSFFVGAFHTLLLESDFYLLSTIVEAAGLTGLLRYLLQSFSQWGPVSLILCRWILTAFFALSIIVAIKTEKGTLGLLDGLAMGAFLSVGVFFLQFFEVHPVFSMNRSAFWLLRGRYCASFSDPNALGLMTAILAPVLLLSGGGWRRWFYGSSAAALIGVVPWSGSRTVWLGFALWIAAAAVVGFKRSSARLRALIVILMILGVVLGIVAGYPPLNKRLCAVFPGPGTERVLRTIHWQHAPEMLESRQVFAKIGTAMWKMSPLIGVGLGRFYGLQDDIAQEQGIALGEWRDNANNFYLHIAAEQGGLGLLLLLFTYYLFRLAVSGKPVQDRFDDRAGLLAGSSRLHLIGCAGLVVVAILLVTGPHVFFDEVRAMVVVLLALAASRVACDRLEEIPHVVRELLLLTLIVPIVFSLAILFGESDERVWGLYPREYSAEDGYFVWTGKTARFALCRKTTEPIRLRMRALNPDLSGRPLAITISRVVQDKVEEISSLLIADTEWREVWLESWDSLLEEEAPHVIIFQVSRVWSPSQSDPKGDSRWLGVMLSWPEDLCTPVRH